MRSQLLFLCVLAMVVGLGPRVAHGSVVEWTLFPPSCQPTSTSPPWVEAGRYGVFYFGTNPPGDCGGPPLASGIELDPTFFASPGASPPNVPCGPLNPCFKSPGPVAPPWIAMLDFPGWHASAVAWTALATMDASVTAVVFPLTDHLSGCGSVTDADVLGQLALLAELVDDQGVAAPLAINMSFGRLASPTDAVDTTCVASTLSCQISRLLAHLTYGPPPASPTPRLATVASAGNHRALLFPASLHHVVAAGALELARYTESQATELTWESPPFSAGPVSIMPGSALCLGGDDPSGWAVPSGTSFATAITSGAMAHAFLHRPELVHASQQSKAPLAPRLTCPEATCASLITQGSIDFPTTYGASSLLTNTVFGDLPGCGPARPDDVTVSAAMVRTATRPHRSYPSLVEVVAGEHRPTPEPDPCVPCSMSCEINPFAATVASSRTAPARRDRRFREEPVIVTIDLHASWALEPNTTIEALYLRHGEDLLEVRLSDAQRQQLARGEVSTMRLGGQLTDPTMAQQASLIWIMSHQDPTNGQVARYWHATPMPLRAPE